MNLGDRQAEVGKSVSALNFAYAILTKTNPHMSFDNQNAKQFKPFKFAF